MAKYLAQGPGLAGCELPPWHPHGLVVAGLTVKDYGDEAGCWKRSVVSAPDDRHRATGLFSNCRCGRANHRGGYSTYACGPEANECGAFRLVDERCTDLSAQDRDVDLNRNPGRLHRRTSGAQAGFGILVLDWIDVRPICRLVGGMDDVNESKRKIMVHRFLGSPLGGADCCVRTFNRYDDRPRRHGVVHVLLLHRGRR